MQATEQTEKTEKRFSERLKVRRKPKSAEDTYVEKKIAQYEMSPNSLIPMHRQIELRQQHIAHLRFMFRGYQLQAAEEGTTVTTVIERAERQLRQFYEENTQGYPAYRAKQARLKEQEAEQRKAAWQEAKRSSPVWRVVATVLGR